MQTAVRIWREKDESKRREDERNRKALERVLLQEDLQAEEQQLEQLNKPVECWERADRMRCFTTTYAEKTCSSQAENEAQRSAWIEWANQQADRMNSLVIKKPASVLDRKRKLNWW